MTNEPNAKQKKSLPPVVSLRHPVSRSELSEEFVASLDRMDTAASKQRMQTYDIVRYLLIAVFGIIFIISSANVADSVVSYIRGQQLYSDIASLWDEDGLGIDDGIHLMKSDKNDATPDAHSGAASLSGGVDGSGETMEIIISRLNKMRAINEDIYGWIKIEGCDISYPIVQGTNNSFYLRRDFYKNHLNAGCIFADYRNSKNINDNRNTVIYGHNMNDGSMFAGIHNYESENTFNNAPIVITTLDGVFTYEVFSVHVPHERSDYFQTDFSSDDEFLNWAKKMKAQSTYFKDVDLKASDKILTLSTCVNTTTLSNYRFAVHAKLVDVKK